MQKPLKTDQIRCLSRAVFFCAVLYSAISGGSALASVPSDSTTESARSDGVTVGRLRLGLGNLGRVGCWIPIHIEAAGFPSGANVKVLIVASDARGDQCEDTVASVKADSSGSISVASVFMTGRLDGAVNIRLLSDEGNVFWEHVVRCRSVEDFSIPTAPSTTAAVQS